MMKCKKCGKSLQTMLMEALICDLGARMYPGPMKCTADGGEHDLVEIPEQIQEKK